MRSVAPRWSRALACVALLASGPVVAEPGPKPSFLLVTFDTTRADRIGAYGYADAGTPTLDGLAERGVLFEAAQAPTPVTLPSHASILTGTYPSAHGVHDNAGFALEDEAVLVSEVLGTRGWRTGAFVGSYVLDARFGLGQGFEVYRGPSATAAIRLHPDRPAREVVNDAIAWFSALDPTEPFFAWVHFYDPHRPLERRNATGREIADPYQAAIRSVDRELGRLLAFLEQRELDRNLLVVATADHGESNGEHAEETHGIFLYQSVMRVPLIIAGGAAASWRGVRLDQRVTNAAIAPTLLHFAGVPASEMPAVQLAPLLTLGVDPSAAPDGDPVYLQTFVPFYSYGWHGLEAVVWDDHKLVRGARPELYSLADDPAELRNLAETQPSRVEDLEGRLTRLVAAHRPLGWATTRSIEPQERELLESLGYVSGGDTVGDPLDAGLPDPRERIGEIEILNAASGQLSRWLEVDRKAATAWQRDTQGRHYLEKARELARPLQDSDARDALILLGTIEYELGNVAGAISPFERLVEKAPGDAALRWLLAEAYWKAGRREDAIAQQEVAISLLPRQGSYYQALILWLLEAADREGAQQWMDRYAAAMEPGSADQERARSWIAEQRRRVGLSRTTE